MMGGQAIGTWVWGWIGEGVLYHGQDEKFGQVIHETLKLMDHQNVKVESNA